MPYSPREIRTTRVYRLIQPPPYVVSFPSIAYEVRIRPVEGCPQIRLEAVAMCGFGSWTLCQSSERLAVLERAIYADGFPIIHPTVCSLIMDRLCGEGRAQRLSSMAAASGMSESLARSVATDTFSPQRTS